MTSTGRDPRLTALAVLTAVLLAGGLLLAFFGVGSGLSDPRTVRMTVLVTDLPPEVAEQVAVGDEIFTDPAGMVVGRIVEVDAGPDIKAVPDSSGSLNAAEDPVWQRVRVVIEADGRQSADIVAVDNEVVQAGQTFSLISRDYYLRGTVIDVDVR